MDKKFGKNRRKFLKKINKKFGKNWRKPKKNKLKKGEKNPINVPLEG